MLHSRSQEGNVAQIFPNILKFQSINKCKAVENNFNF